MALQGFGNGLRSNTFDGDEEVTLQTLLTKLQSISDEVDFLVKETTKQANTIQRKIQSVFPQVAKLIEDSKVLRRDDLSTVQSPVSITPDAETKDPSDAATDLNGIGGNGSWKETMSTPETGIGGLDQTQSGQEADFDEPLPSTSSEDQGEKYVEASERSSPLSPPPPSLASIGDIVENDSDVSTAASSLKEGKSISPPSRSSKQAIKKAALLSNVLEKMNDAKEEDPNADENVRRPRPKKLEVATKVSKGPQRYTTKEIDLIGTTVQKYLKDYPVSDVFDLVSKELKMRGYDRTPGTLSVQWYTKIQKLYADPRKSLGKTDNPVDERPKKITFTNEILDTALTGDSVLLPLPRTIPPHHVESTSLLKYTMHKSATTSLSTTLVQLRLGNGSVACGKSSAPLSRMRKTAGRYFTPSKTWTGASNDILDVSWSPSGLQYVAGNAAQEGRYNRTNNLLLGSIVRNSLRSLPDHRSTRPPSESTFLEPWSYKTVASVAWADDERTFYSASYDKTVKVWEVSQGDNSATCVSTWEHKNRVVLIAKSCANVGLVATGTSSGDQNLRVYPTSSTGKNFMQIPLLYHHQAGDNNIRSLKFGLSARNSNQLLVGFGSDRIQANGLPAVRGYLGLWRFDEGRHTQLPLNPYTRQVFDVAWSNQGNLFLAGCSGQGMKRSSVVRLYSSSEQAMIIELACPAADINEVGFSEFNDRIAFAAATNRTTYLWDVRNARAPMFILPHAPNASGYVEESDDTGVRIVQWGSGPEELFTGSSDGALKQWDIRRHKDDALVENVIETGIELMCGRLSPDKTNFLIGDASGSLHILSRSATKTGEAPEFLGFESGSVCQSIDKSEAKAEEEVHHGSAAARQLIESGEIEIHPEFGPVQGPRYSGGKKNREYSPVLVPEVERTKRLINMSRKRAHEDAFGTPKLVIKLRVQNPTPGQSSFFDAYRPNGSVLELFATEKHIEDGGLRSILDRWNELSTDEREQWHRRHEVETAAFKGRNLIASKRARFEDLSKENEIGDVEEELGNEDGSDHFFPPAWSVDANIHQYRSET